MTEKVNLNNIDIVLNKPRYPENIGAAARAIRNMGLRRLIVVEPENFDMAKILKLATHAAADVAASIEQCDSLKDALESYRYVVGTTARVGGERQIMGKPEDMARHLIPISVENRVAIVFGSEDRGLVNEDIRLCHILVNIPTAEFSSLNLAQAVMIVCYELFKASLPEKKNFVPRLASRHELDGMYEQLKDILVRICYVNPENPDYWLNHIRHFFTRIQLKAKEVSIIRGLCRQVDWYAEKRYKDGLGEKDAQFSNPDSD